MTDHRTPPKYKTLKALMELDDPYNALTVLQNIVDLTGAYRLLAVMLT